MTSEEIWTIDDIIKDYEEKGGISSRSKIDFLKDIEKDLELLEVLKEIVGMDYLKREYIWLKPNEKELK